MRELDLPTKARMTSELVPDIELTHGRAVWVLEAMGFGAGVGSDTFNHYIKSLRKLGVPFGPGEGGTGTGRNVRYSFCHLGELCLALTLRVYGVLPDNILRELKTYRRELCAMYRRAYLEHRSGLGAPVRIAASGHDGFEMSGIYLDLKIRVGGGRVLEFGPPRLVSSFDALRLYSTADMPARAHLPINLSALIIAIVERAEAAPNIHRGPHSSRNRPARPADPRGAESDRDDLGQPGGGHAGPRP